MQTTVEASVTPNAPRYVQVLIFDDVEVLDFAGPFEVFGVTGLRTGPAPFRVETVGLSKAPIRARNGLEARPSASIDEATRCDVLVLPGGFGTRREMHNATLLDWIRRQAQGAEAVLSVCTGALLLARAGLLDGLDATTHHVAFDELAQASPSTNVLRGARYVDNGHIVTSAGISAGIDASLHVVAKLLGHAVAVETAEYMEYDWNVQHNEPQRTSTSSR
jgi:transcriptional regulator GlxA family with amidase domain